MKEFTMMRHVLVIATGLAIGVAAAFGPSAVAQSRAQLNEQFIDQDLYNLDDVQLEMQRGNEQIQADEIARQRMLRVPEQATAAPVSSNRDRVRENPSSSEPALFDDHKDVRHDTDDRQRNSAE
jgi:hypothetical protein